MAVTVQTTDPGQLAYASFPIEKTEHGPDGTLYVYGKATTPEVDTDDQIVDPDWSAKAMQAWFETGPNVRVQHNASLMPAGSGVKVEIDRDGDGAHWVKAAIDEPTAKMMVEKKHLRAFSVGIARPLIVRDVTGKARGGIIAGGELAEISLVDRPANRSCYVELAKAASDGSAEFTGKVVGADLLTKAAVAEKSVTLDLPADVSVSFSPSDLAKLLTHRAEAERRQADAEAVKDWASWDAAHRGLGGGVTTGRPAAAPKPAGPAGKPAGGNSAASASDAWHHAHQTLQQEHHGGKPSAADLRNAHLVHEAHVLHEEHEAALRERHAAEAKPAKKPKPPKVNQQAEAAAQQRDRRLGYKDADPDAAKRAMDPDVGGGVDRDKIPAEDFAGPGRTFPIVTPKDVADTVPNLNHTGHDPEQVKGNIKRIARRKGPEFVAQLPQSWRDEDAAKAARKAEKRAREAAMAKAEGDGGDCETCDGTGKIMDGHRDCPDCGGGEAAKAGEPEAVKAGKRSCKGCGKDHHSDSPAKFCDNCGGKLPGAAKEEDPDLTKKGGEDAPPGDDEDDEDSGSDLDGDDEDDDADEDEDDDHASKASKPSPGDGVTGEDTDPVPAHREPDGPAIEALEHDAGLPTVRDSDMPKAASLRLKALGVPADMGALHDILCPAYDPADVAKCHPWSQLAGIDTDAWREKAMSAAASAPLDVAARMAELWQHAETVKATDPAALAEVSDALHKAFSDANPGPGTFPTPAELSPQRFRRPYISAGHAANSPQASGPNTAQVPAVGGITATDYTRGYLDAGHAADSPSNKGGDAPPKPGASNGSRLFYRNTARDNARSAMQALHDHIAQTFPDLCAMKDDPHADAPPKPGPLPVPVGKAAKSPRPPAPVVSEPAADIVKAAGAAVPDLVKAAVAEATAGLSAQLTEALALITAQDQKLDSQAKTLKKQAKAIDQIAAQPDPVAPYRGAPLHQPDITKAAPAGHLSIAGAAEQSQRLMYDELHRVWRDSPDPTERLAAERAMARMRGLPGGQ